MKFRSSILALAGLCIILSILACGCTRQQAPPAQTPTVPPTTQVTQAGTGIPNPASVYCGDHGGKTEIKKDVVGNEYGMCTFPNETSCEEWALFRGEGCKSDGK